MIVYVVRHAVAYDRDPMRWPDDRDRPLTRKGERRFRRAAAGLQRVAPNVDVVLASPFARTWKTAMILREEIRWPVPLVCEWLEPGGRPESILDEIRKHEAAKTVAIVGHEPDLHEFCAHYLVDPGSRPPFELKKGGVACLRFDHSSTPPTASLRWLLAPSILRKLGS
jgi:phosphohistidine phosphatase